ncbi:STM2901 family protein [Raoultella terrigena]
MDTVEELNGTYFYAGKSNLTASELFFMVFIFNTADQFGIKDIAAAYGLYAGINDQATRTKAGTAIKGTSKLSKAIRKTFAKRFFPWGIKLPTWIGGYTPWTVELRMVRSITTWVGRTIPLVGEVVLLADVSQIAYNSVKEYNTIARGSDKLW